MAHRRLRVVATNDAARKPEKSLPTVDYSGDLSDDQIRRIRESVREEIDSGNWKTVGDSAW